MATVRTRPRMISELPRTLEARAVHEACLTDPCAAVTSSPVMAHDCHRTWHQRSTTRDNEANVVEPVFTSSSEPVHDDEPIIGSDLEERSLPLKPRKVGEQGQPHAED